MKAKEIIVLVIIVAVVGGLFASGILDFQTVWGKVRAIFYGAPSVLSGPETGSVQNAKICRENLRQIESGKRVLVLSPEMSLKKWNLRWDTIMGNIKGYRFLNKELAVGQVVLSEYKKFLEEISLRKEYAMKSSPKFS